MESEFYLSIECVGIGILFGVHQEAKESLMCMPILLSFVTTWMSLLLLFRHVNFLIMISSNPSTN